MSNSFSIAAVTSTLQQLLLRVKNPQPGDPPADPLLVGADVSARPLDQARQDNTIPQLNLFLYQVTHNPQLRNNPDLPPQARSAGTAQPPVALDLHFLLTAYSPSDDLVAHRLLGWSMSFLHDHALLLPADIRAAMPTSDLDRQIERVRITPHPITTEELSRLWTIFQTGYRVSVAYQVSVVLISSTRQPTAPLPVLRRNVSVLPSVELPYATIDALVLPSGQMSAHLGESVQLQGHDLGGAAPTAFLATPLLAAPLSLSAAVGPDGRTASLTLPAGAAATQAWPAGFYTVSESPSGDPTQASNAVGFALAPKLTAITPAQSSGGKAIVDAHGALTLTVTFVPDVWPGQRLTLLLGARTVDAPARTAKQNSQSFTVPDAPLGAQIVRVRVDGVDSLIIDYSAPTPAFAAGQSLEIAA